ncbi:hypothetical protein [Novosphingobium sp. HII-3]|uniref:hypothetical protein n=1 Tax=Novosphingobium sp. HII-3 TaxID=2075565 RepID=UPI000CDB7513|nr:hypothetical protein [Novosphingobium sp. HII-3]
MAGIQAGGSAGRLSIEIVAEVARLQADLDKCKRAVNAASADIGRSAKAANDNLAAIGRGAGAGVQQFTKDVAALKARLDPAWASMQAYRQEVALAQKALQQGAITHAQYVEAIRQSATAAGLLADKQKVAAVAAQMEAQAQREAAQAAQAAAQAAQEAARQQAAYAAQAANVRAQLDPMFAAQQRFNQQMDVLDELLRVGALRQHEYAAATDQARTALQSHAQSVMRNGEVLDDVGSSFNKSSGSARNFSLQMSQVGQQVMAGTGLVQALAIQLPDITAGMNSAQEGAGRFARFMGGPWGIAVTTAIGLAVTFGMKLLDEADAAEDATDKLKKNAEAAQVARAAKAEFEKTEIAVTEAIIAQEEALGKVVENLKSEAQRAYEAAGANLEHEKKIRSKTKALLEEALAQEKVNASYLRSPNAAKEGNLGFSQLQRSQQVVADLEKRIAEADASIARAQRNVVNAQSQFSVELGTQQADALERIRAKYEGPKGLIEQARRRAVAEGRVGQELQNQISTLRRQQAAEIDAAREADNKPRGPTSEERRAERLARESVATEVLVAGLYKLADAYSVSDAAAMQAEITAEATAQGIKKQADVAEYVAQQLQKATAEQVVTGARAAADLNYQAKAQSFVNAAVKAGTLDAENASTALANMSEQRGLLTAMNAAGAAGDKQGYEAAKKALDALTKAQIADNKARREAEDLQRAAQINRSIDDVKLETRLTRDLGAARIAALRGLSGDALEDELARIAKEHAKIAIQMRAEADAAYELKLGHKEAAAAIMRKAEADKTQVDAAYGIKKQTVAIERYNDQLRNTIGLLGNLGKVGEGLGAILGIITGNTGSVGGPLGDLLNLGMKGRNDKDEEIASTIGAEVSKIFKKDGAFVKAVQPLLQNAGIGMAAGSALFGKQSTSEQLGSAIGGALGGKVGEKALSKGLESIAKGLGDFAGPLGSIVGGVLGNVLGSAFTKVKWGRVDLSAAGVSGTSGNSKSSQKAALAAGDSIFGGLQDLARQFGGTIGEFGNISVGVRHGDYRVNTGGTSLKVKKGAVDFNDDAEAAVAYAMKMAIERGAINGIRQSTNNLLKAGDDLATQINKALSFEGVFSELKSYLDPVGYEVEGLEKEFASLRTIFAEAGATAAEYAQLEQLLTIKRQEALNKEQDALNDIRSRIAEVQGDDATMKAIARAKELRDATSDAQRAELQRLYALEDAAEEQAKLTEAQNAATAAAEQLRQAWKSVGTSIMDEVNRIRGLTGGDDAASFVTLQGRFNAAVNAARSGDQEAASRLVDLSQSLLEAAGNAATSRQELDRIRAQTAATLEGVYGYIEALDGRSPSASAVSASTAVTAGTEPTLNSAASSDAAAEMRSLRAELAQMRADMNSGNAALISSSNRIARRIEDVSPNGDAISVASAA